MGQFLFSLRLSWLVTKQARHVVDYLVAPVVDQLRVNAKLRGNLVDGFLFAEHLADEPLP